MKKELTKRQIQAEETRKKIYEAAKNLFSKHGYDAVSIDEIVKAAGVARGSFYVYFLSKEDLSIYMMFDGVNDYKSHLIDYCSKLDKSLPASQLIIEIACGISLMAQNMNVSTVRTMYKIFIERSASTGSSVKDVFEMPYLFIELYKLGVKKGEFIETDAAVFAENIKTVLVGLTFEWCLYHPNYDFIGRTRALIADYLKGFKTSNKE